LQTYLPIGTIDVVVIGASRVCIAGVWFGPELIPGVNGAADSVKLGVGLAFVAAFAVLAMCEQARLVSFARRVHARHPGLLEKYGLRYGSLWTASSLFGFNRVAHDAALREDPALASEAAWVRVMLRTDWTVLGGLLGVALVELAWAVITL
jgi:hypothetical protein